MKNIQKNSTFNVDVLSGITPLRMVILEAESCFTECQYVECHFLCYIES
jgi:hypothetical protein